MTYLLKLFTRFLSMALRLVVDFWIQIFINNVKDIDTTSSMQDTNKNI